MGLETGTYISDLNSSNPASGDTKSQGDDHLRLIKSTVKASFPGVTGAVTSTHTELNILDGATVSTAELNYVAGVTSAIQTQLNTALAVIPSGTVMVFYQAAAPTGWTQSTAHNDKALRVVSGSGGGSGGTHDLTSPPSLAHVHTGPSHTHTGPSHNHQWHNYINSSTIAQTYDSGGSATNYVPVSMGTGLTSNLQCRDLDGLTGVGQDGYTTNSGTGNTGSGGTGNTGSTTPTAFAPKYIDVIICSKD